MIRRPPRSTQSRSSAASDVYKRQIQACVAGWAEINEHHFEAFTMLIEPDDMAGNSKEKCTFAVENIQKLYTRKQ